MISVVPTSDSEGVARGHGPFVETCDRGASPGATPKECRLAPVDVDNALQHATGADVDWPAVTAAFRAGDAAAADAVARHVLPFVSRLVSRLSAWRDDADDLVQDVLVSALTNRTHFRGDAKLETWITRIAVNACRAHARKRWVRRTLFAAWADRRARQSQAAPAADETVAGNEQATQVRAAVARLPAKHREAIVLCYLQSLTPAEAAKTLGVSRGTVEVRLSRARAQLKQLL